LNGGVPTPTYVGLAGLELDAVVQVAALDAVHEEILTCTGTLVAPTWVLSAAHCETESRDRFAVRRVDETGAVLDRSDAIRVETHPDLDLMLLEVPPEAFAHVPHIPPATGDLAPLLGQRVQLAGTGYAEGEPASARLFSVATVMAVSDSLITVDAGGYAGACEGDSGGPLLIRGPDGVVEVAGTLSVGSVSCWAEDDYVRSDIASDWIASITGIHGRPTPSCGTLDRVGRCFGNVAVWCDGSALAAEPCQPGHQCGFDGEQAGFRCVSPSLDRCRGFSDVGSCSGGDAVSCADGEVLRNVCSVCGADCVISPRSGRAVCVEDD
jgi:hypothetical protein